MEKKILKRVNESIEEINKLQRAGLKIDPIVLIALIQCQDYLEIQINKKEHSSLT